MNAFRRLTGPARAIAIASAVVVELLATAFGITLWQNGDAHTQARAERVALTEKVQASQLATHFWREREAMNEYLLDHDPKLLSELRAEAAAFRRQTAGIGVDTARGPALVRASRAANVSFLDEFDHSRSALGSRA